MKLLAPLDVTLLLYDPYCTPEVAAQYLVEKFQARQPSLIELKRGLIPDSKPANSAKIPVHHHHRVHHPATHKPVETATPAPIIVNPAPIEIIINPAPISSTNASASSLATSRSAPAIAGSRSAYMASTAGNIRSRIRRFVPPGPSMIDQRPDAHSESRP